MLRITTKTQSRYFLLWSFLAPILAWMFQLVASFLLASYDCKNNLFWLHATSVLAFLVSLSGQWTALQCGHFFESESLKSYRFLANLFLWLGALFTLTIVAQSLPNFTLEVCQ